ncbi:hypothetical protein HIM_09219 [Hirsutella minnesotensis 3608]|uniref:AMP-dependent synthetase/ligase domain-containing protein n=1 Tax=Hirsutella minnesotensis 3608 TaxID=1043627 RepID=A0A0F7ZSH6_9HYPO|nr:hypothetical protein HIM_09219 [Hirsutella minnesotensis 3608]
MAISGLPKAPRRRITPLSFGDLVPCPFPTVTAAFYHHASSFPSPSPVAVRDLSGVAPRELTYAQLAGHAQALALRLRGLGVQPGQRIPLVIKRGLEMVIGIWAVLSCGAQYVPLDGGVVPDSTIKHVVGQCGEDVVLCLTTTEHRVRSQYPYLTTVLIDQCIDISATGLSQDSWIDLASPDNGCYTIYTSGTTGKPKGVDVTHKNVVNLVCLSPGDLAVRPGTCVGQVLNISFDMAAWEIFACLCNGGTLVLRGSQWEPTIRELDVLICTPTILSKYQPVEYPKIKVVATAGEPTCQALADLWARHAVYWNCCGPTETTIVNTMSRHVVGMPVSIGKPTPNNSIYILDEAGQPAPEGVTGVIWAGGYGVSRGYMGLDSKTNKSFIPDPFLNDGSNMYCTGDLGKWRSDGSIDILGRCDDQVKVKGFRVELDGICSSLASAPGVARSAALLVNGEIHGFIVPPRQNIEAILEHTRKLQPYYAIPAKVHQLGEFPITANGKVDKKALRALAAEPTPGLEAEDKGEKEERPPLDDSSTSDCDTLVETRSISSSTATAVSDTQDLDHDLPNKRLPQPLRGLRHRILIVYRTLFSLVGLLNIGALISIVTLKPGPEWLATLTAANLVMAVLIRQDIVINSLYSLVCSMPLCAPLWMRRRCAKIYHLGGVHSGAGVCAASWLLALTIRSTVAYVKDTGVAADSLATLIVSWLLSVLCCVIVGFAWPSFRKKYHNLFERLHRFLGWTALSLFWVRTILSARDATRVGEDLGLALVRSPGFWMLGVATCSIASSWLLLRRVPVDAVPLSEHAIQLNFNYTVPINGSFTRISTRPLLEWHSFATIPVPDMNPSAFAATPGYSLIVSNAGDWTKACIRNPPTQLWVRGLPTYGVMRIATLFNRIALIATGSGIGPLLGHISQPCCPTQLLWSTPSPEQTFGKKVIYTIRRSIPGAVIHDTKVQGRPDLVKMGYNLAKDFGAEAVIIIANEKITKKVVYGLESRGLPAYGAIWDS